MSSDKNTVTAAYATLGYDCGQLAWIIRSCPFCSKRHVHAGLRDDKEFARTQVTRYRTSHCLGGGEYKIHEIGRDDDA